VVLNKIDLVDNELKIKKIDEFKKKFKQKFYEISVLKKENLKQILRAIK
jgi:GTP-binding protein